MIAFSRPRRNGAAPTPQRLCPARILGMQQRNILAGQYVDRAAHLRKDPAWFANALADERSRYLPVWNSRNLIGAGDAPRAGLLDLAAVPEARRNDNELILLGRFGDSNVFAYEIE